MRFQNLLADRTHNMGSNAIRETLKVIGQPGMISLAGGLPAPESFPIDLIEELTHIVIKKYSTQVLQYGPTDGFPPLKETLVGYVAEKGIKSVPEDFVITTGSQNILDAVGKILINKGDPVAVESPTYLGALSAFNPYEPKYISMATDEYGLIPESLEDVLKNYNVKFVYLIPTFQNPSGRTIPRERRERIAEMIIKYNALLYEDDPYCDIRFAGEPVPPIKTLAPDHVIYAGTFSKIFSPGIRIGFAHAPELIRDWIIKAKQGIDLHTNSLCQALAAEYVSGGYLKKRLPQIIALYKTKCNAMLSALDKYFPKSFNWSRPEGGMFVWAEGPDSIDTSVLYLKAAERKVVYVPGKYFMAEPGAGLGTMRLNYTNADEATIDRAIKILAGVLEEELEKVEIAQVG